MNNEFEDRRSDDPNSVTTEDREVLKKMTISPTDVKDALDENNVGAELASGVRVPETGPKLIFGILLVVSGILIAVATSISIIGIVIGAVFVIAGLALPFSNFGSARRGKAA